MAISRLIRHRVETDAKAPDYWYVPKGQAVNSENWHRIADHLQILSEFQTVPWSGAQPKFARALLNKGLIDPYKDHEESFSAVARMQFPVWSLLGLAWINTKNEPEITEVGSLFVGVKSASTRLHLLTMQLHRYQFYNPSLPEYFAKFQTFPILALYRLLTQVDWKITWDEFRLFGTRMRSFEDADALAQLIEEWRALTGSEQQQLLSVAQTIQAEAHTKSEEGTTWGKVDRDLGYIRAVLRILPTLGQTDDVLFVRPAARKRVNGIVLASASSIEYIDYETEQDWLAVYGQPPPKERWANPWSTASEARAYYERVGRIDAAAAEYAKEGKGRTKKAVEEYRSVQVLERVLEDLLEHNLEALEKGLKLVGRQYPTAVGPIDLLAKDSNGIYVVIELKKGQSGDKVVGQIARYLTWVMQRLGSGKHNRVRGVIVGKDFDKRFAAAIAQLKKVSSYTFDVKVLFERWPAKR